MRGMRTRPSSQTARRAAKPALTAAPAGPSATMARTNVPRAISWPPWKTATASYAEGVATEAGGTPAPSYLFAQNGTGGTLSETTLTLAGVSSQTAWFTDRPYREAGQVPTEEFIALWDEGETFAEDPPNADFTCTIGGDAVNYVVELTSPSMAGGDLSYSVNAVSGQSLPQSQITCEAESNIFIDIVIEPADGSCIYGGAWLGWWCAGG